MINNTKLRVPKKYEHMIDEINHDSTGYWVNLEEGYYSPETGCHTIHETSQKAVLEQIRKIQPETYDLREADGTYIETDMTFTEAVERYKTTTRYQDMHSRQTGDSVEKLWDIQNLNRDPKIILDEAVEDLERLQYQLDNIETESCGMSREELEKEYQRVEDIIIYSTVARIKMEQDVEEAFNEHVAEEVAEELDRTERLKQRTVNGQKVVLKKLGARDRKKYGCAYVITVDGVVDWEEDNLEVAKEFFEDWGN